MHHFRPQGHLPVLPRFGMGGLLLTISVVCVMSSAGYYGVQAILKNAVAEKVKEEIALREELAEKKKLENKDLPEPSPEEKAATEVKQAEDRQRASKAEGSARRLR